MSGTVQDRRGSDGPLDLLDVQVAGRTAVVTGAGNGLGRRSPMPLATEGRG
jgi:hypothetical protein